MKNIPTPRQKSELARRKAMPLALIQRPLKHIAERDHSRVSNKDGTTSIVMGLMYIKARLYADAGLGQGVRYVANLVS